MSNPFLQFGSSIQTNLWEWESAFLIEATEAVGGQQTVPRSTHQRHSSLGDKEYCLLDVLAVLVVDFLCEAIALFLTLQLGDFSTATQVFFIGHNFPYTLDDSSQQCVILARN